MPDDPDVPTTTADEDAATWQATSASARGSSHTGAMPNQDAVLVERLDGEDRWFAAVSDGHGGPRYVRSHIGSDLAVRVARDVLVDSLAEGSPTSERALRDVAPRVVRRWREEVTAHLAAHPLTEDEAARAHDVGTHPYDAYGATLLLALVGAEGVALAQIGDGDALLRVNGFATRPMPNDDRLVAGMTTSLCLETAENDFRFASLPPTAEVDLVMLASDGYGNSFAAGDWWRTLVDDLVWFVHRHGFSDLDEQLPSWLAESAEVGGDDVSVACLVLDPLSVPAVDPAHAAATPAPAPVTVVAAQAAPQAAPTTPQPAPQAAPQPAATASGGETAEVPVAVAAAADADDRGAARPPAAVAGGAEHATTWVEDESSGTRASRRTTLVLVAAALVAVLAGAGTWAALRGGPADQPSPGPTPTPSAPASVESSPTISPSSPAVRHHRKKGGKQGGGPGGVQGSKDGTGTGDKVQPGLTGGGSGSGGSGGSGSLG